MEKFIVTYHAPAETRNNKEKMTPENHQNYMGLWNAWMKKCGSALVDMGAPVGYGQNVTNEGAKESNRDIVGYSILQSDDIASAKALLEGHPHLAWDPSCDIQIHQLMQMPS